MAPSMGLWVCLKMDEWMERDEWREKDGIVLVLMLMFVEVEEEKEMVEVNGLSEWGGGGEEIEEFDEVWRREEM
ncbi:uncharacterized protein MONOS_17501 [Monocercomonoides exilis]|uniref:uncharacterized protein n=1 Tax=Monocercomonoides exilis TaxID=2049356 RepID=UPI003559BC49|nr:hypothetical protein MONOS_17501 [Monocercomonoides exilis]